MQYFIVLFFLLCAASAQSQFPVVSHAWTTTEVIAGSNTPVPSPNGILEPGEAIRFGLTGSFTPPVGAVVTWQAGGTFTGTVEGLAHTWLGLRGSGGAQGSWSHESTAPGWFSLPGSVELNGAWLANATVGQLSPGDPSNPAVNIWSQVWTPLSYTPRTVTFQGEGPLDGLAYLWVRTGTGPAGEPIYQGCPAGIQYAITQISIVPAPASTTMFAVAALMIARRRRPAPRATQ